MHGAVQNTGPGKRYPGMQMLINEGDNIYFEAIPNPPKGPQRWIAVHNTAVKIPTGMHSFSYGSSCAFA
jgi:hypothetical protein